MINKTSLRASVLGANDGILSISAVLAGLVAHGFSFTNLLLAGLAAIAGGAVSMAAGEYISVSAQSDSDKADIAREKLSLSENPMGELEELTQIYQRRGWPVKLAKEAARVSMKINALEAHAREELGITLRSKAQPLKAALSSGLAFTSGALVPFIVTLFTYHTLLYLITSTFLSLGILGFLSAIWGGSSKLKAIIRVVLWGALAMGVTSLLGHFI